MQVKREDVEVTMTCDLVHMALVASGYNEGPPKAINNLHNEALWFDDVNMCWMVTKIFLTVSKGGEMKGEYGSMPEIEFDAMESEDMDINNIQTFSTLNHFLQLSTSGQDFEVVGINTGDNTCLWIENRSRDEIVYHRSRWARLANKIEFIGLPLRSWE